MQDEEITGGQEEMDEIVEGTTESSGKFEKLIQDGENKYKLTGMYRDWFLDYASYVILERAVPHITDGFKPVQRRIMHAMKNIDDGRYNKVANIIGQTMQYHPHGDASIGDALVQLGQKDLLVDCQGNWGNILTGDSAAAPRYIEARLSEFAKEVVFNPKTTEWMNSYDGRNQEPVNLPVKFPLLLVQGDFLPGCTVSMTRRDTAALEAWDLELPESCAPRKLRYLLPKDRTQGDVTLLGLVDEKWSPISFTRSGSYLVFDAPQGLTALELHEAPRDNTPMYLAAAGVGVLALVILTAALLYRRRKKKSPEAEPAEA
jgi:hypothetical protein